MPPPAPGPRRSAIGIAILFVPVGMELCRMSVAARLTAPLLFLFALTATAAPPPLPAAAAPPPTAADAARGSLEPAVEQVDLETSDGVQLAAWYYAAPQKLKPLATVILLHDLAGSHAEVEPLALALQRAGCAVVAPDLRGHGASCTRLLPSGREESINSKSLRKSDIEAMVASAGGRIRDQSSMRGDIEAVRHFLKKRETENGPSLDRLCVIGTGAGATLAALWTMADAAWPPTTTGPQGGQVRAVVCISPVWAVKSVTVLPALSADPLKRDVPVLVLGGRDDRDAVRFFEQFKRSRPQAWFEQRAGQAPAMAPKLSRASDADVLLMQLDTRLSGEKLAVHRAGHQRPSGTDPSELIKGFLAAVLARK